MPLPVYNDNGKKETVILTQRREERADVRSWGISGTGLGLYVCRELVERHGGRLWFESEEGTGSTFFLTLPMIFDQEKEDNKPSSSPGSTV